MHLLSLFVSIVAFLAALSVARADYRCQSLGSDYKTAAQSLGETILNAVGKTEMVGKLRQLNGPERETLGIDLSSAKAMERAVQRAMDYSSRACPRGVIDGFQDAVRHFILSSTLASEVGRARALELLDAHESGNENKPFQGKRSPEYFSDFKSSLMDIRNNSVGAEVGSRYYNDNRYRKRHFSDRELILELAKAFREQRLQVTKRQKNDAQSGSGDCEPLFKLEGRLLSNPSAPIEFEAPAYPMRMLPVTAKQPEKLKPLSKQAQTN